MVCRDGGLAERSNPIEGGENQRCLSVEQHPAARTLLHNDEMSVHLRRQNADGKLQHFRH